MLVEIEGTINSQPITPVSDDINNFHPLTPNHFLIGRPTLYHRQGIFTETELNSTRKWKVTQALLEILEGIYTIFDSEDEMEQIT